MYVLETVQLLYEKRKFLLHKTGIQKLCILLPFILFVQDPGRDGSHMQRHHQLGHSQYCCGGLMQFCHFQRRCADLPLEGQLRSRAPAMDHCSGARQGKGCPNAGWIWWEGKQICWKMQETEYEKTSKSLNSLYSSAYVRQKCVYYSV